MYILFIITFNNVDFVACSNKLSSSTSKSSDKRAVSEIRVSRQEKPRFVRNAF